MPDPRSHPPQTSVRARLSLVICLALAGSWVSAADVLDFSGAPMEVDEGVGTLVVLVARTGGGSGTVTVTAQLDVNFSHSAGGIDYPPSALNPTTLTWVGNDQTPKALSIPLIDDAVYRVGRSFGVTLSAPSGGATLAGGQPTSRIVVQILDNDPNPAGALTVTTASGSNTVAVSEHVGTVPITVTRSGGTTGAVTATVFFSGGATIGASSPGPGVDYIDPASPTVLTWADGVGGAQTFNVTIVDDAVPEPSEDVSVLISVGGGAGVNGGGGVTITIIDDDPPLYGTLSVPDGVTVHEADGHAGISVARVGGSQGTVTIDYATSDGTASAGDYTAVSGTLTWTDGDSAPKTITVPITDDSVAEVTKTFFVIFANPTGGLLLTAPTTTYVPVTILDDDTAAGVLGFTTNDATVGEGEGNMVLTITRTGGSSGAVDVTYTIADETALAGRDYAPLATTGTLHWADHDGAPKTITVPVIDNATIDGQRNFMITLSAPTNGAILDDDPWNDLSMVDIAIFDNDHGTGGVLAFTVSSLSVREDAGTADFHVARSGGSIGQTMVSYTITSITALPGSDYLGANGVLTWADGDASDKIISVPIIDDAIPEGLESFSVGLSVSAGTATIGSRRSATCFIVDDDASSAGTLAFTATTVTVAETASQAVFTVARSGGASGAVSVQCTTYLDYYVTPSIAREGVDFIPTITTISWADGDSADHSFSVPVLHDGVPGTARSFHVRLSDPTGGVLLDTLHGLPSATGIITETDVNAAGTLSFSSATAAVGEGAGSALLTVSRHGGHAGTVTVQYASQSGSAVDGSDFTAVAGTLSWADGDHSDHTITIPILDDALVEGDETFSVRLSSPTGGANLDLLTSTVTIHDDEVNPAGQLQFTAATTAVHEGDGTVVIHVARGGGSAGAVSVDYQLGDVTTTAGVDYTASGSGTLHWAAGDASDQTITITVLADTLVEGDETLQLTLSDPSGGATLGLAAAQVVISDPVTASPSTHRRRCGSGGFHAALMLALLALALRRRNHTTGLAPVNPPR